MKTNVRLLNQLEGSWSLHDSDGKLITTSEANPGATLTVEPLFYEGLSIQTIGRIETVGGKGRHVKQMLNLHAINGKVTVLELDKERKQIKAPFDALAPLKSKDS